MQRYGNRVPELLMWVLFVCLFCFEYFLTFRHYGLLHTLLGIPVPVLESTIFPRNWELWFFLLENGGRHQDLGTKCAYFCWGYCGITSFKLSMLTELGNKCVCSSLSLSLSCFLSLSFYKIIYIKLNTSLYCYFQLQWSTAFSHTKCVSWAWGLI